MSKNIMYFSHSNYAPCMSTPLGDRMVLGARCYA